MLITSLNPISVVKGLTQHFFAEKEPQSSSLHLDTSSEDGKSVEDELKFDKRTVTLENLEDFPEIQAIFQGNILSIDHVFFPKKLNYESKIIFKIIEELILRPSNVEFVVSHRPSDVKVIFEGKEYPFYKIMQKVKWDLINLSQEILDQYEKNFHNGHYHGLGWGVRTAPSSKAYLYKKLHNGEKRAIYGYSLAGNSFNRFLRGTYYYFTEKDFKDFLCHTAVLCNGLNKIPESQDVKKSGYVYRCLTNSDQADQQKIIDVYQKQLKTHQKVRELGFTGVSYKEPLRGFLQNSSYAYTDDCMKIYVNPEKLAKDISGLSGYPYERECLFLPNTKELLLRSIVYPIGENSWQCDSANRHLFLSKVISKRQKVI